MVPPTPTDCRFHVSSEVLVPAITTKQLKIMRRMAHPLRVLPGFMKESAGPYPCFVVYGLKNRNSFKAWLLQRTARKLSTELFCQFRPSTSLEKGDLVDDIGSYKSHAIQPGSLSALKLRFKMQFGEASHVTNCTFQPRPLENQKEFISGWQRFSSVLCPNETLASKVSQQVMIASLSCVSIVSNVTRDGLMESCCSYKQVTNHAFRDSLDRAIIQPRPAAQNQLPTRWLEPSLKPECPSAHEMTLSSMAVPFTSSIHAPERMDRFVYTVSTLIELEEVVVVHKIILIDHVHAPQQITPGNIKIPGNAQFSTDNTIRVNGSVMRYVRPDLRPVILSPGIIPAGCEAIAQTLRKAPSEYSSSGTLHEGSIKIDSWLQRLFRGRGLQKQ